jgi:hypothetical protein
MKALLVIYLILFALLASSCQKSTQAGVSGVSSNCISNPGGCSSSLYQQNQIYGYSSYGNTSNPFYYSNNTAYLCNCPYGTVPTYNSNAGLGCVSPYTSNFSFYAYIYIGWNNSQWYNLPHLSSLSSNCYSGAMQSCLVNSASCPGGSFCLQSSAGSSLGLCVTNYR